MISPRAQTFFFILAAIIFGGVGAAALRGSGHVAVLPDPTLTPGAVRTTDMHAVCDDRHTSQYRHWTREQDNRILHEYGLPEGPHPDFEVDHLISLNLGGADSDENLWPQPRYSIVPYAVSAEAKDRTELALAVEVCDGRLDLKAAQRAIAKDWTKAKGLLRGAP